MSGPDPTQIAPRRKSARPGDDSAIAAAVTAVPAGQAPPEPRAEPPLTEEDAELLGRSWRAEQDHVGNWQRGDIIPAGVIQPAHWVRKLQRLGHISAVED